MVEILISNIIKILKTYNLKFFFLRSNFQQQSCNGPSGRLAEAPAQTSVCANNGDLDYMNALGMSIMFYEANMAGELPSWHRIPWRGDSTLRGYYKTLKNDIDMFQRLTPV